MNTNITMRATYDSTIYESDEPDTEPTVTGGFTDPHNPWGGFRSEVPDGLVGEAFLAWRDENVETVEFDDLCEAAQFVVAFPGGVWDHTESEHDTIDYSTGQDMAVTLHVNGDFAAEVLNIAGILQDVEDRVLAARREKLAV